MAGYRSFDAFAKPVDGITNKSAVGGIITLIAGSFAAILFLSQLAIYYQLEVRQHFHLAKSYTNNILPPAIEDMEMRRTPARKIQQKRAKDPNNIKLSIHVSYPYIKCSNLQISLDGASKSNLDQIHGRSAINKRPMTKVEISKIQKEFNDGKSRSIMAGRSCTFEGFVYVPRVGGSLSITLSPESWHQANSIIDLLMNTNGYNDKRNQEYNMTHFTHNIEFGTAFPHLPHPLRNTPTVFHFPLHTSQDQQVPKEFTGIGLSSISLKLVHVQYKRFARSLKDMYQMSMAQHIVAPTTLSRQYTVMMPGFQIIYDFTPFSVLHSETRENIFLFLGSLVSIVAGVFVTVGLVSSCFLTAVNTVGKKKD